MWRGLVSGIYVLDNKHITREMIMDELRSALSEGASEQLVPNVVPYVLEVKAHRENFQDVFIAPNHDYGWYRQFEKKNKRRNFNKGIV